MREERQLPCLRTSACVTFETALFNPPVMENPCYKCGQAVEEGIPFCPHCGAPQIRVVISEGRPAPAVLETVPPAPSSLRTEQAVSLDIPSTVIRWPQGFAAAATAGMVAGLGMTLMGLFGLWMIAGGLLSVYFYRRRTRGERLRPGAGARLGALSGTLGFSLFAAITVPTGFFRIMMTELIHKFGQQSDPQFHELTQMWLNVLNTRSGLAAWLICLFLFMVAAAALGGALGGVFFGRKPEM